jgi:hypothetical protein
MVRFLRPRVAMTTHESVRFVAPDHTAWTVHEVTERDGAQSLLFVSADGFRRVRHYPMEWRTLGPVALWELSWKK